MRYEKIIITLIFLFFSSAVINSQNGPVSQIEGILEVFSNIDSTSVYLGKNVGRNVDSTWYFDELGADMPFFNNTFIGTSAGEQNKEANLDYKTPLAPRILFLDICQVQKIVMEHLILSLVG